MKPEFLRVAAGAVAACALACVLIAGCAKKKTTDDHRAPPPVDMMMTAPPPPSAPYNGDHPIDRLVYPLFSAMGIAPVFATDEEVCRRLFADLIGRFPTLDETKTRCAG